MNVGRPEKEFETAYVALFVRAERTAARVLHDPTAAEDVAAETMTRAYGSWDRIGPYAEAWVTRVSINLALDSLKRTRPRLVQLRYGPDEDSVLERQVLVAALRRLSGRQRQALALRYLVGLSDHEVATTLGVNPDTIRTHVRRGLATLRQRFGPDLEEALRVAHRTP